MAHHQLELGVPAPFRLDLTSWALRRRAHNTVDRWHDSCYRRTFVVEGDPIEIAVRQHGRPTFPVLTVEMQSSTGALSATTVVASTLLLERTLGLGVDLAGFYELSERDERLRPLAQRFVGMRPPRLPSVFEAVVNAIACQQLSLVVGIHLLSRLSGSFGLTATRGEGQPRSFPTPESLAMADPQILRQMGFSGAKARSVIGLARQVTLGEVDLEALHAQADADAMTTLLGLPGVGRWSAEYTLLRGLGRLHVLPGDDVGARNNLRRKFGLHPEAGYEAVAELSRAWWPYGGLVYFHLLLDSLATMGLVTASLAPAGTSSSDAAGLGLSCPP
jgi:DNA-3-methyladenine glycosylase II